MVGAAYVEKKAVSFIGGNRELKRNDIRCTGFHLVAKPTGAIARPANRICQLKARKLKRINILPDKMIPPMIHTKISIHIFSTCTYTGSLLSIFRNLC